MAAAPTRLIVEQQGDIACVSFVDQNILEENAIQQIGEEIRDLVDSTANPKVLLIFGNVEHLSSAALGMLITVNNRIRQRGGQLRLSDIHEQIYEVFVITKLNKLFQIYDQAQEAVDSFK
jgi:anti-sigma B factor antagonist